MNPALDSYKEALNTARDDLKGKDFQEIAERAGGKFKVDCILVPYLIHTLKIDTNTLEVSFVDSSSRIDPRLEILTLHYLRDAKGIKPSGKLISFKETPHGMNYYPSFHNRTEKVLLREFKNNLDSFKNVCEKLGAEHCQEGEICYKIKTLPFLSLSFVFWEGDEEFPPNASILFDETCSYYLLAEDLAILGELVCEEIVSLK